nr:MAG TPA: hypothetical protein [Inoviridae sp.]
MGRSSDPARLLHWCAGYMKSTIICRHIKENRETIP